eukprot:TRINITY_DN170_c1_g3_i1.p1 TRINITY_DN170_c1_g3~~TRINITY_DN170_c1_g3_i1.p1  ORF type:complete len:282 (+),score=100.62 TRINITY_DN170_c1_g3_i1:40-846(+)
MKTKFFNNFFRNSVSLKQSTKFIRGERDPRVYSYGRPLWSFDISNYKESFCQHLTFSQHGSKTPDIGVPTFIAASATIVGDVKLWSFSSIFYNSVLLGDQNKIEVGLKTNIQDNCVITSSAKRLAYDHDGSTRIGHFVTIGHGCKIHAATIENSVLVGMGSILSAGSYIKQNSILGANSLLLPGQEIGSGQLWAGNPAKFIRELTENEIKLLTQGALNYVDIAFLHQEKLLEVDYIYDIAVKHGYKPPMDEDQENIFIKIREESTLVE